MLILKDEKNCDDYIEKMMAWFKCNKVFQAISEARPFDANGELNITDEFKFREKCNQPDKDALAIADKEKAAKAAAKAEAEAAAKIEAENAESNIETVTAEDVATEAPAEVKKGRGRPAGSTNKA